MNTSELIHHIAKDRIEGMKTIIDYKLTPFRILVNSPTTFWDLNNDMFVLNTHKLPVFGEQHISYTLKSSDNYFTVSPSEYELMDEYRYQVFTDYIDLNVSMEDTEVFRPFYLEFIKITPFR
ncbi:hypothetical protein [Persicobacter psychrovividus]|uniref:Uncharacterized protein n=1 Tax=Persicobacter psychrovividus TaxID=387638 RepID=A0ABM7VN67_9BACT|nr:hypothetical protein PEPS_47480 [Persicobacter psychrovividus]